MNQDMSVNSNEYWDRRFDENWEEYQGPTQSRFFARIAIEHAPRWLIEQIKRESLLLADWGCAQGDGTNVWANYIDPKQIIGVDFSSIAIQQACQRYSAIRFLHEDWLIESSEAPTAYDVVFSSNTLEHFHNAYDVLDIISERAKKAIMLALPYKEIERIEEHLFSFIPENIPFALKNGFRLVWSQVIDCRSMPNTQWSGDQIILIYANEDWIAPLNLTLSDCLIGQNDSKKELTDLQIQLIAQDSRISDINHALEGRNNQISHLNQMLDERNNQISLLNQTLEDRNTKLDQLFDEQNYQTSSLSQIISQLEIQLQLAENYKIDKEIYIAQLLEELQMRNRGLHGMVFKLNQRFQRIQHYANRSWHIILSGGLIALLRAIKFKLKNRHGHMLTNYVMPTQSSHKLTTSLNYEHKPLLSDELIVITGVPFDDVGGGQRGAQLARCALRTGRKVIYIYVYPKFDFELNQHVESNLDIFGLKHTSIDKISPSDLLSLISSNATALIEFPHPKILPYLEILKTRGIKTVFELIDDWETSLGGDWFDLNVYHSFVEKSDVVVGTAKLLVQRLVNLGREDALYLPNAANEYIFDKYKSFPRPNDLPKKNKKIALYFGSLYGEWFAWDYVVTAAQKNPELDIILIGDKPGKKNLPNNIHFLGAKKIEELPGYLEYADITILPFVPGKISDAVSPIKVFEYLFAGKPVVSTFLPEIVGYPGVFIADTPQEFADLCMSAAETDELLILNDHFISKNSWYGRLDAITHKSTNTNDFNGDVSAIILIHNNMKIIGRCLDSLLTHGKHHLREIIVVDNASSDGGAEFIEHNYPNVRLLRNAQNGCSSGRNLGVSAAGGQYLAFFDSDQWFTSSSFFEEALNILKKDASVGVVGWAAGWFDRTRTDLSGMIADYCPNRAMNEVAISKGYRSDIGYLGTGGFFIPKSVFDATSGFDTYYDPTCFEDTDLSFQVKNLGFKICYRDLTGIRHQPHQTTGANNQNSDYTALFLRNAEYFKKKWAEHPDFFTNYTEC